MVKGEPKAAYVLIKCEIDRRPEIVKKLMQVEGIDEIQKTYGEYDIIVRITGEFEKIKSNIRSKICQQSHVRGTITLFYKDTIEQHERVEQIVNEIVA
ncbi:hypothetical protein [Nitrosopumilus sp.]|uniref:hypothetical protein n=1 Tax=Nitrosopumilus sp. TaxID=2024843 RepID=UPI003D0EC339